MTKPAAAEPSMEEILASIRRIIADEDPGAKPAKPEPKAEAQPKPVETPVVPFPTPAPAVPQQDAVDAAFAMADEAEEEALDLGPPAMADFDTAMPALDPEPEPPAPKPRPAEVKLVPPDPFEDVGFVEPEPPARAVPPTQAAVPVFAPPAPEPARALPAVPSFAPSMQAAPVASSGELLAVDAGRSVAGSFQALETAVFGGGRTIDDITKELLRPMLKQWLDDNLPPLVERLVAEEIQRVSRGPRR